MTNLGGALRQESGPPGGSKPWSPGSSLSLSPQGSLPGSGPGLSKQKPELKNKLDCTGPYEQQRDKGGQGFLCLWPLGHDP